MATHYLNRTIHKTWNINKSNDSWVLGEDGRIIGNGFIGVLASDSITDATIRINGDIVLGGEHTGLEIGARHAEITIGKTGYVYGGYAIHYNNGSYDDGNELGTVSIYNKGILEGTNGIIATTATDGGFIRNAGRIDVSDDGIMSLGAHNTIVNSGLIKAGVGIMAGTTASSSETLELINAVRIVNEGTIKGSESSIVTGGVAVNISNRGLLRGDVLMGDGDDIFTSGHGTVKGDILAGGGNDIIAMQGAIFEGAIHGGAGDDTVTLASATTSYIENEGEGIDTVRVNASYTLGANIENLVVSGAGNHTGVGNALDNWIRGMNGVNSLFGEDGNDVLDGRKGHDTLTGGAGADVFVFNTGYGSDLIMDFEKGSDKIDLANFDGIASIDDLTINSVGADLVITFSDTDELVLKNATASEMVLTADDFIF